jgi:carboxyl-terminal processing protease
VPTCLRLAAILLLSVPFVQADDDVDTAVKKAVEVFSILDSHAADPVPSERAFYEGAIPGMLRRLDPHSIFFDPGQFQQLKELEKSTRKGFGTVVSLLPGRVIVLQVFPNTPSARAGLSPGDEILAVNNIPLNRLDVEQLVQVLGQTRQRQAKLDVRRPGNARLQQFVLTPEDVDAPAVDRAFELRPGIGYVRVTSFEAQTGQQVREAIEKLGGSGLKGLVLDLRNNPGGMLPAALETAAMFLQPKERLLSVRGRKIKTQDIDVPDGVQPYTFPVAVLVNAKSASGSEIVAGALQDHKRAVIVGEPTYGKGLVQSVYNLAHDTGLALTTAFYYTPSGRSIQKHLDGALDASTARAPESGAGGIQPDKLVYPDAPSRLRAALEMSGSFPSFATNYIQTHPGITDQWTPTPAVLDEFRALLSQRRIQPGVAEWTGELDWVRWRLQQEIYNQALGVEKGDVVELRQDPQVQAAEAALAAQ